jgi:hypothetical protein
VLHDHDLVAEQVLSALGGDPCLCLLILDALRDAGSDLRQETVGWRSSRALAPPSRQPLTRQALQRISSDPHLQQLPAPARERVLSQWRRRLVLALIPEEMAGVIGEAGERRRERRMYARERPPEDRDPVRRLRLAAAPAIEAAMRASRRDLRPWAPISVECWKRRPGDEPLVSGSLEGTGGFASLSLPVSWLNRVSGRGLAVVGGHFVIEVDRAAPATELTGQAVRWERGPGGASVPVAAPCSIRRWPEGWELTWDH